MTFRPFTVGGLSNSGKIVQLVQNGISDQFVSTINQYVDTARNHLTDIIRFYDKNYTE